MVRAWRFPRFHDQVMKKAHVLVVCWALASVCQAQGPRPTPAVQQALDRGVAYLRSVQQQDGTWQTWGSHPAGETALAGMALIAAGLPPQSGEVCRAQEAVRRMITTNGHTYDISLVIMFLDQLGDPKDVPLLRQLGERLLAGQAVNGTWSYGSGGLSGGDNSNTQFAAIACWVTRKHGIVQDAALQKLDGYFRTTFIPSSGGWGYVANMPATPTMTCAGLAGLAAFRGAEQQAREATQSSSSPSRGRGRRQPATRDPTIDAALTALGGELKLADQNPGRAINADLYFFWSLERVAMIYGLAEIGGVDWYRWGSTRLIKGQSPDGQWQGSGKWRYEGAVGTSFAMLFLSRLNVAADLTAAVGLGTGAGEAQLAPSMEPEGGSGGTQFIRRMPSKDARRGSAAPSAEPEKPINLDPRQGRP
jgi:hypothetical protein